MYIYLRICFKIYSINYHTLWLTWNKHSIITFLDNFNHYYKKYIYRLERNIRGIFIVPRGLYLAALLTKTSNLLSNQKFFGCFNDFSKIANYQYTIYVIMSFFLSLHIVYDADDNAWDIFMSIKFMHKTQFILSSRFRIRSSFPTSSPKRFLSHIYCI